MSADTPTPPPAVIAHNVAASIVAHPWRALMLGVLLLMAALPGAQYITQDFSYRVWFDEQDPLLAQFDAFERRFGNDESVMILVHSPSGIFDPDSAQTLVALTEALWQVNSVIRVDSLANYNWVHADGDDVFVDPMLPDDEELTQAFLDARKEVALAHPVLPGWLINAGTPEAGCAEAGGTDCEMIGAGTTTVAFAALKPGIDKFTDYGVVVGEVRTLLAEFRARPGDHIFFQTGQPAISNSFKEATQKDLMALLPITFGLTILFLLGIFKRVSGVLLPLVIIGTSVAATMGLLGWFGMSINNMTSIIPQILLAIGVADAVHILTRYYRALKAGASRHDAAYHTLFKNFQPTLVTSLSTAIGFMSFATAAVVPISQLGILTGIGTLFAWLMTYLVLGPLIVLLPIGSKHGTVEGADNEALNAASPRGLAIADGLFRRRVALMSGFVVLTVVGAGLASQTEVNSDPLTYFPEESEINQAAVFMERELGGSIALEVVVDSGVAEGVKDPAFMAKVEAFQSWIEALPYCTSATSILDVLKSMNKSLNGDKPEFYTLADSREGIAEQLFFYTMSLPQGMDLNDRVSLKQDALRLTMMWDIHDSKRVLEGIERVEAKASALGLNAEVTGKVPIWQRMNPYVVETFVTSILIALVLMSLLLMLVLRSFWLGLIAMIPNGVPLLLGGALLVAVGKTLDVGSVIVFSVCLGIAVDDTVHFLASFNRLRRAGYAAREAVARTYTHTMPALIYTTTILVVAFGVFAFAQFIPNRYFGLMVAFILALALATDATLLPALLMRRDAKKDPSGAGSAPAGRVA